MEPGKRNLQLQSFLSSWKLEYSLYQLWLSESQKEKIGIITKEMEIIMIEMS